MKPPATENLSGSSCRTDDRLSFSSFPCVFPFRNGRGFEKQAAPRFRNKVRIMERRVIEILAILLLAALIALGVLWEGRQSAIRAARAAGKREIIQTLKASQNAIILDEMARLRLDDMSDDELVDFTGERARAFRVRNGLPDTLESR